MTNDVWKDTGREGEGECVKRSQPMTENKWPQRDGRGDKRKLARNEALQMILSGVVAFSLMKKKRKSGTAVACSSGGGSGGLKKKHPDSLSCQRSGTPGPMSMIILMIQTTCG